MEIAPDSRARLERIPGEIDHVHLIGVGGSAMAALAGMLAERGLRVTGSDDHIYEPTASLLRRLRIEIREGYGAFNLTPSPDLCVVGNVITRANPEAAGLLASNIPYLSMPEALWHFFLREPRVLMVAGTHGKTTSTAIMAHILASGGRDPSMLVGGVARDFNANYRLGQGVDFVIEGDEYDTAFFDKGPKFLHYRPAGAIVTAVEFDHADIYRDLDHVKASFRALAAAMGPERVLVVSADFPEALDATAATRARRLTFGLRAGEYRAGDLECDSRGAHFSIVRNGQIVARGLELPVGGRMNVANALGVWVLLNQFDVGEDELRHGLASFSGVARRQEVVGEAGGVTVIDDFAHHPTAIRSTLEAIAERYPHRRILAAFEPRSNTARRAVFQSGFAEAFDRAARVYLAPVYFKENDPIPSGDRLNTDALAEGIGARGPSARACGSVDEIVQRMLSDAVAGDIMLCMSNGPFEKLTLRLLEGLRP
ncbi:MAG TPA: Mur ligase family protein [Candidatus Binataceae bacterium]|nr:Mur ligase family protein [Candidatus Binataceae bacterium]